ncbi:(d)CMP kinase [Clostridium sp. 19966]|uniref:(d)CMP kinase n=1 Tax=Clostridium sp. 19966 TaxID=2768166 RepID=UPI0037C0FAED
MRISIAIDGPAGAGKSTIAKIVADKLNIMYINTGLMYRAVTYKALKNHISTSQIEDLCALIDNMNMHFDREDLIVNDENLTKYLTSSEVNQNVSFYASIKEIRERLVNSQRNIAKNYDIIMDGRDIGTVVLKNAAFKFFITATPEERAKRRLKEMESKGVSISFEKVLENIISRDFEDSHRAVDPLIKAEDALEIDTTDKSIEDIVNIILAKVRHDINES